MPESVDAYKVLQVDPEAEAEVIRAAYRRLARKYHPDLTSSIEAADRMAAINAAWELIGKPVSRAAYDRARAAQGADPPSRTRGHATETSRPTQAERPVGDAGAGAARP